jgi:energy-coupling factor transporter ATP-binding protein EcfA2
MGIGHSPRPRGASGLRHRPGAQGGRLKKWDFSGIVKSLRAQDLGAWEGAARGAKIDRSARVCGKGGGKKNWKLRRKEQKYGAKSKKRRCCGERKCWSMRFEVRRSFEFEEAVSSRAGAVCRMFGVTAERLRERGVVHSCELEAEAGDIIYITGASGAGKSVILRELEKCVERPERVNLDEMDFSGEGAVIDLVGGDVVEGLRLLSVCGLSDCFCVLGRPGNLSEGEKWRLKLAMALASGRRFVFCDEFCSGLDAVTAAVVSHNVRKFAKQRGVTFFLAGAREDVLGDLRPEVLVVKERSGEARAIYKENCIL